METINLPIRIDIECPELDSFLDTECVPQTHVDLAYLEYIGATNGADCLAMVKCLFWLGLESKTLRDSRN